MRVLSGIQPSGDLHLGNYFGAIKQQIEMQDSHEVFYFVANFHALTSLKSGQRIRELSFDVAVSYLALGLDPEKATLFLQSDVPEVTELAWIFSTVTGVGQMERAVSYKDKVARGLTANVGLFTYPILQTADILIYKPDCVPVGADQVQHIEICNDIAQRFNSNFGSELFKPVQTKLSETPKVPGLDGQKMSKSYGNTVPIFLQGKKLKKTINSIVTDSTDFKSEPLNHETCHVFQLYSLFATEAEKEEMIVNYRDNREFGFGHAKVALREMMDKRFGEARARRDELIANPKKVYEILGAGAAKARKIARETLDEARKICGLA